MGHEAIVGISKTKDIRKGLKRKTLYDEDDIFTQKIERMHKMLQTMRQEKEMVIGLMLAFSENPTKILDSICSEADVDHLIVERIEYVKSQKVEN